MDYKQDSCFPKQLKNLPETVHASGKYCSEWDIHCKPL
jgi:hypothetical protein